MSLLSPTGQLPHHQRPALHAQCPGCHHLAIHSPPAAGKTALSSLSPETGSPHGALTAPPTPSPGASQTSALERLLSFPASCLLSPAVLVAQGRAPGTSAGLALSQVNGVLPILPLLFPVLWVLATACGEARVLAQMSKASPSSLVSSSRASGRGCGTVQKEPKTGTERQRGLCPQQRGQKCSHPTSRPAAQHTASPGQLSEGSASLASRVSRLGPRDGQASIHPCSQQTGSGAARCPSWRGARPPPAGSKACGTVAVSFPSLTPSSLCSWPSSRRTLLAAIQKPCPLRYLHPDGCWPCTPSPSSPRPLLEPPGAPALWP